MSSQALRGLIAWSTRNTVCYEVVKDKGMLFRQDLGGLEDDADVLVREDREVQVVPVSEGDVQTISGLDDLARLMMIKDVPVV